MKSQLALWIATLLMPLSAIGSGSSPFNVTLPYKEVIKESVKFKQPVVYARAGEHGFGVQYTRVPSQTGGFIGGLAGGLVGSTGMGLAGQLLGTGIDQMASSGPTDLAQGDAEKLAQLYDREAAQRELENKLAELMSAHMLFLSPAVVKPLADEAPLTATAFEDPALVVELHTSLIVDYRGLQVTALVYEFSASEQLSHPEASKLGRVYRNRLDYVSDLLPAPHVKTPEEIRADVDAVKAKYRGRKLTKEQQAQQKKDMRDAKNGTTLDEWREPLMAAWTADKGARLHEALKLGTAKVVELLAKDWQDTKPVEIQKKVDVIGWRTLRDVEPGRYTSIFVGGPFPGALISEPSGLSVDYCRGTAFTKSLWKNGEPRLCAPEQ
jgi:hypothetical protein